GSDSCGSSSGTYFQSSLPRARPSSECCTQTTGTRSARAFGTSLARFETTESRSWLPRTTPFWTSMTRSAVLGRFCKVVMPHGYRRACGLSNTRLAPNGADWAHPRSRSVSRSAATVEERALPTRVLGRHVHHGLVDHLAALLGVRLE